MTPDKEQRIRQRAYEIWQREGCPEGHHQAHWEQARREIETETRMAAEAERSPETAVQPTASDKAKRGKRRSS